MIDPAPPPSQSGATAAPGILPALLGLFGSLGRHIQSYLALAGLEAKEAGGFYLRAVAAIVVAVVLALFGYLLLLLFVAFLIQHLCQIDWMWITLGLGVLHFIGVGIAIFYAMGRFKAPVFAATTVELRRDLEALKNFKA